jgi:plastocyanin
MVSKRIAHTPVTAPLIATLAALAVGGCAPAQVRMSGHTLTVTLSEYAITPQRVSLPAGPIVIVARNRGILTHDIAIERAGALEANRPSLASTGTIMPGATGTLRITLRHPGTYTMLSTIANQADLGMNGTLTIR